MPNEQEIYFSACDLQMEAFIDKTAFCRSLVLSVLFQGDLAIPDIFFYITSYIPDIIRQGGTTHEFLATALHESAIVPIFRNEKHTTFRENLEEIRRQGIQGLGPDADLVCDFLEKATRGRRLHYRLWPQDSLSIGYRTTLERIFNTEPSTIEFETFQTFWTRTKSLREAVMGHVKYDHMGGIRRGDIMNAMHLHLNKSQDRVDDVRTILSDLQDHAITQDAKRLLKWFTYAYQFNQGRMFNLSPSLASMDELDTAFSCHLTTIMMKEDEAGVIWKDEFNIPNEVALLSIDPKFVFEVRNSDTGASYFEAVTNWQKAPTSENSNILLDRLRTYSTELSRLYIAKGRNILNWESYLRAHIPENKIWKKTAFEIAKEGVGELIPHFGLLSLVGPLGAATYEWWPASLSRRVGVDNRLRLEVEPQTQRLRPMSATTIDASFR